MFAKAIVFFFALFTFVNAAPIIDYTTNPGVRPIKVALPDGKYRIQPVGSVTMKRGSSLDIDADIKIGTPIRHSVELGADLDLHLPKREIVDLDALASQIINGLKSNGLDEYVEHFSTRIQRLKDILASDASHEQIPAEANQLLLEYRQILAGLNVNKTRDIRIDSQVLSQVQAFVNNTVNLLRALGKSDAVDNFLSEINKLKAEAQNGTLDAGDLLNAARDIIDSIL